MFVSEYSFPSVPLDLLYVFQERSKEFDKPENSPIQHFSPPPLAVRSMLKGATSSFTISAPPGMSAINAVDAIIQYINPNCRFSEGYIKNLFVTGFKLSNSQPRIVIDSFCFRGLRYKLNIDVTAFPEIKFQKFRSDAQQCSEMLARYHEEEKEKPDPDNVVTIRSMVDLYPRIENRIV